MGTTSDFLKLRSSKTPKTGEWNINYSKAMALAKKGGRPLVVGWSNGDLCGNCVSAEKCMMDASFKNWMKTSGAYFVFQCSADKDKGKTAKNWIYNTQTKLKRFPGFRVTSYNGGMATKDVAKEIDGMRNGKTGAEGAKLMINGLKAMMGTVPSPSKPDAEPAPAQEYKVRLNEALTVKKVNAVLDAIDKNDGYCPCQTGKTADTKCHCKDFLENKAIGEPCICNIFVKRKA